MFMLPNFLGIGVPRSGTTWLHRLLSSHPEVYVPENRKEVSFFTAHYHKGLAYYERVFPDDADAGQYKAVGEISPHYLFYPEVPKRIGEIANLKRFILIVRSPITRAFSHYRWRIRNDNYPGTFEQFLDDWPQAVQWSTYAEHIQRYWQYFGRDQVLILIYERMFTDIDATRRRIAEFLDVDPSLFPAQAGQEQVNTSSVPRFRWLYAKAVHFSAALQKRELHWLTHFVSRRLGVKKLLAGRARAGGSEPSLSEDQWHRLHDQFREEIAAMEALLGTTLEEWKTPPSPRPEPAPAAG